MRLLYQLHIFAFLAAIAQAAATPPKDNGLAARYAEPEAQLAAPPNKRLLGICLFGLSILGDCDKTSTTRPTPTPTPTPSAAPSGGASASGNSTATPTGNGTASAPASSTTPAPETTSDHRIDLTSLTEVPGTSGLNSTITQASFNPYTFVYPQPPLPRSTYRTPSSVFEPTGGGYIPSYTQTRRYNFVIDKVRGAPDGFMRQMFVINGQFPAPLIEANQGDTLEITVTNNLDIPQSLHWHGMRQNGTGWADGVPGIHQCPIPPGGKFTYKYSLAAESGTYWYHSHYGNTMGDGITGALIIHARNLPMKKYSDYDDERIVYLSDWNDNQSMVILKALHNISETFRGSPFMGPPDSLLINGVGQTDCSKAQAGVQCGKTTMATVKGVVRNKLRLRLINHGSEALIRYSIDSHVLTVIEIDDTPVQPVDVHEVMLWPGQRISVLISLKQGGIGASFFMRARMAQACLVTEEVRETKAKLQYTDWLGLTWFGKDPVDNPWPDLKDPKTELCHDIDEYHTFTPSVIEDPPQQVNDVSVFNSAFGIFIDHTGASYFGFGMNDVNYVNYINNPLLKQIMNGATLNPAHVASHTWNNAGAYDLIINQHDVDPLAHPFHLHGRPFHIIARGKGSISAADLPNLNLRTVNPLRRDTMSIPGSSYAVIRVITDDPGVWPIHCHIGWHVGVGKLGVLVVRPDDLRKMQAPSAWDGLCAGKDPNEIDYVRRDLDPITGLGRRDSHRVAAEVAKRKPYQHQAYQHNATHWWVDHTPFGGKLPEGM